MAKRRSANVSTARTSTCTHEAYGARDPPDAGIRLTGDQCDATVVGPVSHTNLPPIRRPVRGLRKGDRRREAILEALERLLDERSIAELSVEAVAEAAGISRSGFYFYFESKYAALSELMRVVGDEIRRLGDRAHGADEPPEVYVPRATREGMELSARHQRLLGALFEATASDPGARAVWEDWLSRIVAETTAHIEAERAAGRAPSGPPADLLARALVLMNQRMIYDMRQRGVPPEAVEPIADTIAAIWLAAVWGIRAG